MHVCVFGTVLLGDFWVLSAMSYGRVYVRREGFDENTSFFLRGRENKHSCQTGGDDDSVFRPERQLPRGAGLTCQYAMSWGERCSSKRVKGGWSQRRVIRTGIKKKCPAKGWFSVLDEVEKPSGAK